MAALLKSAISILNSINCCKSGCCESKVTDDDEVANGSEKTPADKIIVEVPVSKPMPEGNLEDPVKQAPNTHKTGVGNENETTVDIIPPTDCSESANEESTDSISVESQDLDRRDSAEALNSVEHRQSEESVTEFVQLKESDSDDKSCASDSDCSSSEISSTDSEEIQVDVILNTTVEASTSKPMPEECLPDHLMQSSFAHNSKGGNGKETTVDITPPTDCPESANRDAQDSIIEESMEFDRGDSSEALNTMEHRQSEESLAEFVPLKESSSNAKPDATNQLEDSYIPPKEKLECSVLEIIDMLIQDTESGLGNITRDSKCANSIVSPDVCHPVCPDVCVIVQGELFKCHQDILVVESELFKQSLGGRTNTQPLWRLNPESVTVDAFSAIMTYIYKGHLKVGCNKIPDIFKAAKYMKMEKVIQTCLNMIDTSSNQMKNVLNLYAFAYNNAYMASEKSQALETLAMNFEEVVFADEYLDLNVQQLVELLSQNTITTRSESVVFLAGLKWLDNDYQEREKHAQQVLDCVRFHGMTAEELTVCIRPPILPQLMQMPEIKERISHAICYVVSECRGITAECRCGKCLPDSRPRNLLLKGEPIVLWDPSAIDEFEHESAAIVIQAAFRSFLTRKRLYETGSTRLKHWIEFRKDRQDFRRRLEQHQSELRDIVSTAVRNFNEHYKSTLKTLFQKKSLSAESLEY